MPTDAYARFVHLVWTRLEERTGKTVFYIDRDQIAAYCPACKLGVLQITFIENPDPALSVHSRDGGMGHCSAGCEEAAIAEALFAQPGAVEAA